MRTDYGTNIENQNCEVNVLNLTASTEYYLNGTNSSVIVHNVSLHKIHDDDSIVKTQTYS